MQSEFLKQATVFDTAKLYPGIPIYLIEPSGNIGEPQRVYNCLIKTVTPTELTIVRISYHDEVEEKTYPVGYFEGVGARKIEFTPKRESIKNVP
ncbi:MULTISPECIES: hypothetical protein [Bacillus cereus group]|uniref:hypothetical protein n=1 Tax=Bacillus cereus group TaxID=86661 RepID=UPI001F580A2F|nr:MULTISPECIES: hypothetical protein [Bacillus cereus group]